MLFRLDLVNFVRTMIIHKLKPIPNVFEPQSRGNSFIWLVFSLMPMGRNFSMFDLRIYPVNRKRVKEKEGVREGDRKKRIERTREWRQRDRAKRER